MISTPQVHPPELPSSVRLPPPPTEATPRCTGGAACWAGDARARPQRRGARAAEGRAGGAKKATAGALNRNAVGSNGALNTQRAEPSTARRACKAGAPLAARADAPAPDAARQGEQRGAERTAWRATRAVALGGAAGRVLTAARELKHAPPRPRRGLTRG